MKIREVQTSDGARWQCAEALISPADDKSSIVEKDDTSLVTVVCTPSGGAQSVRIEMQKDWNSLSDNELAAEIERKKI
jgi:hypothetical protein